MAAQVGTCGMKVADIIRATFALPLVVREPIERIAARIRADMERRLKQ